MLQHFCQSYVYRLNNAVELAHIHSKQITNSMHNIMAHGIGGRQVKRGCLFSSPISCDNTNNIFKQTNELSAGSTFILIVNVSLHLSEQLKKNIYYQCRSTLLLMRHSSISCRGISQCILFILASFSLFIHLVNGIFVCTAAFYLCAPTLLETNKHGFVHNLR